MLKQEAGKLFVSGKKFVGDFFVYQHLVSALHRALFYDCNDLFEYFKFELKFVNFCGLTLIFIN